MADGKTLEGVRVLIVDDDPDSLDTTCFVLEMSGADVSSVGSVAAGIETVASFAPDVIVSDLCMPGEDGYGFIRRLRALPGNPSRTPAVALTAHAIYDDEERALREGFQLFLNKPVDPDHLVTVLARLVGR